MLVHCRLALSAVAIPRCRAIIRKASDDPRGRHLSICVGQIKYDTLVVTLEAGFELMSPPRRTMCILLVEVALVNVVWVWFWYHVYRLEITDMMNPD